jgi:hypothetical protein
MRATEKSDLPEVARKRANRAATAAAELVERRGGLPHHELDSSVRTQLNRVAVDGDCCGRAPRLASGCSLSGNGL